MTHDLDDLSRQLEEALLRLDEAAVAALLRPSHGTIEPARLADAVISPALLRIGEGWDQGRLALSQVYMAGRLMEKALEDQPGPRPQRLEAPIIGVGVLEDHHALGKRIVCAVLGSAGYAVHDLGSGHSAEALAELAQAHGVQLLMVSVLMLNRALRITQLREALDARGLQAVRLAVGGAPFIHDPSLAERVGADFGGSNAADALTIAARWLEVQQ